jgi:hypothetical protein
MDGLTALRQAISTGREADITEDGGDLVIESVRYPSGAPTAFRQSKTGRGYSLKSVHLLWKLRTADAKELIKAATAARAQFVLVTDKAALLDYLQGKSEAIEYIDTSKLGVAPAAGAGVVGAAVGEKTAAGGAGADAETMTLEAAMRREVPYRTRASVLQAPGKVRLRAAGTARAVRESSTRARRF